MDGKSALREAIMSVPVPGAPPRFARADAAAGLSFLDAGLRLEHVRRLTERLTVVAHRSAQRTTEVDISLRGLHIARRDATSTVWVPVSRISRRSVAPVDVRDAAGDRLPLLTQDELGGKLAAGLYRLLGGILSSHPDARGDTLLRELLHQAHEARWLIQFALTSLLGDQHRPEPGAHGDGAAATVFGQGARYRRLALKVLDEYADLLDDYFALFDVAVNDHLLVVPLDAARDEHLVTYDMPLYADTTDRRGRLARMLRTSADGYLLSYTSRISSSVRSYQLVLDTEPGVHIERMFLSTDADLALTDELHADLGVLGGRLGSHDPADRASHKILELQMQTTLRKLADLVRRREWEADHADVPLPATLPSCTALARVAVSGEGVESDDASVDSSILRHPRLHPEQLRRAAAELRGGQVHRDLSIERDPESHRAHAYWRGARGDVGASTQVDLYAAALLRDTTAAGPRAVRLYGLAVAAMGFVAACMLSGRAWPFGPAAAAALDDIADADAVIAVLLLVPGFLYTRLALPDRHSVSGQLQALSRLVANLCVASVAFAAAAIAAGVSGGLVAAALAGMVVVPLLGSAALLVRRPSAGATAELVRLGAPRWLDRAAAGPVPVDARFSSIGTGP
ncbi:MAG: hypothetical protein ACT4RN_20150 [Pseudonocardia sp.]